MTTISPPRIVFIDLLRGWATLIMIEVHVFNAFLYPNLRETAWFSILNFVNGLVAPSFLFVAGLIFVIVSERKLEEFRSFGPVFRKQLGRIALIWTVGYALHIPFFSYRRVVGETSEDGWLKFFQVDILHCIAFGLLILFFSRILIRERARYIQLLTSFGLGIVLIAPYVSDVDFNSLVSPFIGAYLSGENYSQFPIFPWLGFLLFGGQVGGLYLELKDAEGRFVRLITWWGSVLVGSYLVLNMFEFPPFVGSDIRANPLFFALRFGIVLLLLAACWYYVRIRNRQDSLVLDVSRESLLVYATHLLIIYGMFWNDRSLSLIFGRTFSLFESILATVGLMSLMILLAKVWGTVKEKSRPAARRISFVGAALVILMFFIR